MPDQSPLVVPIKLDALAVSNPMLPTHGGDSFRWWQFNYGALDDWSSPEPRSAGDKNTTGQKAGVYLSWTLPEALRHCPLNGEYPLVPNRWLIVRTGCSTTSLPVTAWVLESDCPYTDTEAMATDDDKKAHEVLPKSVAFTSNYLVDSEQLEKWLSSQDCCRKVGAQKRSSLVVGLGVPFPLAAWQERAPGEDMFLRAVAPGNPLFSGYLPHNLGVFSFYDALENIDTGTLSYFVFGWYSNPKQDILASAGTNDDKFVQRLQELRWTVSSGETTNLSVYHGAAFKVSWDRMSREIARPPSELATALKLSVGNTAIDAFHALSVSQDCDPHFAANLRAFQYDLLQPLNLVDGDELLDEEIRQAWFESRSGGYTWTLVDEAASDDRAATTLTPDEEQRLVRLNQTQAKLDSALDDLYSLQQEVHALWFKRGYFQHKTERHPLDEAGKEFQRNLNNALDPRQLDSVAAKLISQLLTVQTLMGDVSEGQESASTEGKTLKAVNAPRYWKARNPVLLVCGVPGCDTAMAEEGLAVRRVEELINVNGTRSTAAAVSSLIPEKTFSSELRPTAEALLAEFLFFNSEKSESHKEAGPKVGQVTGRGQEFDKDSCSGKRPPSWLLSDWKQPWAPMFLEWSGRYRHIPSSRESPWYFDGTEYRLKTYSSKSCREDGHTISGLCVLDPHAGDRFGTQLRVLVEQFGDKADNDSLADWHKQIGELGILAQELTGLDEQLSTRDSRAFRRPTAADQLGEYSVAELTGYQKASNSTQRQEWALPPSSIGRINSVPLIKAIPQSFVFKDSSDFSGLRQGAFYFTDIILYDKFGRTLVIVKSGSEGSSTFENFQMSIDSALRPDPGVEVVAEVSSVMLFPPRLLQAARFDIQLVDAVSDTKFFGTDCDVMPIAGWVLPNHLDRSVALFAPDGRAMGELRLYARSDGTKRAEWTPPPHSNMTMKVIGDLAPHLYNMMNSTELQSENGFNAFLNVIDETLWTTDPMGARADVNLSVLIGRPLALLRTRLELQLEGNPIRDTGWPATFRRPDPSFLTQPFSIRLGAQGKRRDGVIGYFTGDDYDTFHSTAQSEAQQYVKSIGPDNYLKLTFGCPGNTQYVTLLADPRAAIHAYTGILPVRKFEIPQHFVDAALSAMEVSFFVGPLLTSVGPSPLQDSPINGAPMPPDRSITYPIPAEQGGFWSWWEPPKVSDFAMREPAKPMTESQSNGWTCYGLVNAVSNARDDQPNNTLREGYLQFNTNLGGAK